MNFFKKIIAVVIVACTALSMTACKDTDWVYDYNGTKLPSGLYLAFTIDAYTQAQGHKDINKDQKNLFKQTLDGKDAKQWIIDQAKKTANLYMAAENKFAELKLSFEEKDEYTIKSTTDYIWGQIGKVYEENGVSKETYKLIMANQRKQEMIFKKYYGTGGIEEIPAEQLLVHFKENFASINMTALLPATGENLTDEQKKANEGLKARGEEYVKLINEGGKSYNEIVNMYATFKAENDKAYQAPTGEIKEDSATKSYIKRDSTSPSEKIVKSIFEDVKPDGKAVLLTDDAGYYIVVRYDSTSDSTQFDEMRDSIISELKGEDFSNLVKSWAEKLAPTANESAIKRYSPKKINIEEEKQEQQETPQTGQQAPLN